MLLGLILLLKLLDKLNKELNKSNDCVIPAIQSHRFY